MGGLFERLSSSSPGSTHGESHDTRNLRNVYIAVMGMTGVGKSTFISHLCGPGANIGHNLRSCTHDVTAYSFQYDGKTMLHLIDTPGFDDTNLSDREVLEKISAYLARMYKDKVQLTGIIYMHRITDVRLGGSGRKNVMMFKKLCGDNFYPRVALITTMWETLGSSKVGESREDELKSNTDWWGHMLSRGSTVMRHTNDKESALRIIDKLVKSKSRGPSTLAIQHELVDESKKLVDTAAGQEVNKELDEVTKRYNKELKTLKSDITQALRDKDVETANMLREEAYKNQEKLIQVQKEQAALFSATLDRIVKESDQKHKLLLRQLEENNQKYERVQARFQAEEAANRAKQDARDKAHAKETRQMMEKFEKQRAKDREEWRIQDKKRSRAEEAAKRAEEDAKDKAHAEERRQMMEKFEKQQIKDRQEWKAREESAADEKLQLENQLREQRGSYDEENARLSQNYESEDDDYDYEYNEAHMGCVCHEGHYKCDIPMRPYRDSYLGPMERGISAKE